MQSTSTKPTLVSHFNNIIPYTFRSPLACIQSVSSIEFYVSSSSGAYICPEFYPLAAIVVQLGSLLQVWKNLQGIKRQMRSKSFKPNKNS